VLQSGQAAGVQELDVRAISHVPGSVTATAISNAIHPKAAPPIKPQRPCRRPSESGAVPGMILHTLG
jgi:hypothetical protein